MRLARLALAQISSGTDPVANLRLVDEYATRAADAGARLVVFPEATMCRFGVPLRPGAEPRDGAGASRVREIAAGAVFVDQALVRTGGGAAAEAGPRQTRETPDSPPRAP